MNQSELVEAINAIASEKNIKKDFIYEAIINSLEKAYKRKLGEDVDIVVHINKQTGAITVERILEDYTAKEFKADLAAEIPVRYDETSKTYYENVSSEQFNRVAIGVAAQLLKQQIRKAEKEAIVHEYLPSQGEIMYGEVVQTEPRSLLIKVNQTFASVPYSKLISNERYYIGDPITFLAEEIVDDNTSSQIKGSRVGEGFLVKLMELEIPEIMEEVIKIKNVSRRAGYRSKVAIHSDLVHVDPVGACIGPRGSRINAVAHQLNNERIDVCLWDSDLKQFIINAMSPAKVIEILITTDTVDNSTVSASEDEETEVVNYKVAYIVVPDEQFMFATGRHNNNAKLVSQLTHCEIRIISYKKALEAGITITWNGNLTPDSLAELKDNLQKRHSLRPASVVEESNINAIKMKNLQASNAETSSSAITDTDEN